MICVRHRTNCWSQDDGPMSSSRCGSCCDLWQDGYPCLLYKSRQVSQLSVSLAVNNHSSNNRVAVIGSVEELAASPRTLNLVRDQFETNFFGPVNIIKAALPHMRRQKSGHIMVLSGISTYNRFPILDELLTCRSWSHRYTRSWSILCFWLGPGRILRCRSSIVLATVYLVWKY